MSTDILDLFAALQAAVDSARADRLAAQAEIVDCLQCDGAGFVWVTDPADRDDLIEDTCVVCKGDGVVPADQVATCACCSGRFWVGEGCEHGPEPLCHDCKGTCTDCVDEAREARAEAYAHEQRVLNGGGWS